MTRRRSFVARPRAILLSIALAASTLGSVALTTQSAQADASQKLVVVEVGNPTTDALSAVSLKTINSDGAPSFAKPVDLPTADAGSVHAFTLNGKGNGNGTLNRSSDGNSLVIAGYNKVPGPTGAGGPDPKDTTNVQIPRLVAKISANASVDTTTVLNNATATLSKSAPRSVVTADGSKYYISGNKAATSGAIVVNNGSNVPTNLTPQTNLRQLQIAGGDLYATSDKTTLQGFGKFNGTGLPTGSVPITRLSDIITTVSAAPKPASDSYVPDAMVVLDAKPGVTGIDTAYVVVDADPDLPFSGEIRKYSSDGTTWTPQGTAKVGEYPFLTGRVTDDGTKVQFYATKGVGEQNKIVSFTDNAATGAADFSGDTDIATSAAGRSYRGIAFAPTAWDPGTVTTAAPTVSTDNSSLGATLNDANNPKQEVQLADSDTDAADLTLTATSSNPAVLPNANITFTGSGATRTATFAPIAKGRATVTFTVKDLAQNTGSSQIFYAVSSAPASATGHYLYESSDLSSAVDVGSGYTLAVSSEDSTLRLYKQDQSGRPVKTFDLGADAPNGIGSDAGDLEGMTRVNDTLYVIGSHGNNSSGDPKPNRRVLFTAVITGSGASTNVTYVGKYTGLWDALRTWDQANSNRLGFAAGQASGVPANEPTGFNIEGIEFAPGSTSTAYLGFRSPLVLQAGKQNAVIVPLLNANALILGGGTPQFGDPIYLDLGGRTIREIRKNSDDQYLITAQADATNPQWGIYSWNGNPANKPILVKNLPDPAATTTGSWESIVSVPSALSGASVSLIADSGDTTYYGDTTAATDEPKGLEKSYTDTFALNSFTPFLNAPGGVSASKNGDGGISVSWNAISGATSYKVTVKDGATNIAGSPKTVTAPTTSTTFSGLSKKDYTVTVTAVNADGESNPSNPEQTVTPDDLLANNTKPTISGTAAIDQTLTVTPGTWTPAGVALTYQWAADGTNIAGATNSTLVLGADQVGKKITVTETASKGSSSPVSATSTPTAVVAQGQFFSVAKPTVTGTAQVGQQLTASDGLSLPTADSFSYRWYASGDPNTAIAGANTSTFTLTADLAGQTIKVAVLAHRDGYTDSLSAKSDPTGVVDPLAVSNTVKPSIPATAAVDQQITVDEGTWVPASGVTFTYQWIADGTDINRSDATSKQFTPTSDELGKKLSVRVTGSKTNLTSHDEVSNETSSTAAGAVVNQTAPVLSGTAREGQQLSTTDGTWTPGGTTYSYQWKANGTAIVGAGDASTYTLTSGEVGKVITVEVTASKSGFTDAKKTSNASDTVDPSAVSNTAAPTIGSAAVVGTPITVTTGSWQPSGVGFAYQWLADGAEIPSATSSTFTPTGAQFGQKISVRVTGSKSGLTPHDEVSNQTSEVTNAIVNDSAPVISGQLIEGKTLTTTNGTWTPTPTDFTYVWKSGGIVIAGESTNQLVIPAGTAGSTITVEVTGAKAGYNSAVKASAPTAVVDPSAVSNLTLPSIPTTPVVGTQVTADHGTWNPSGVSYAYQWLADGNNIGGATSQSFTPTSAQAGKKLSVKVTASKSGLTSATATSAETAAVTGLPPVFGTPTNLTVTGTTASTITVSWTKSTDATKYRLYYGIGTGTRTKVDVGNVSSATFSGLKPNQAYTIDISAFKANGTQSAYGPSPRLVGTTDALTAPDDLSVSVRAGTSIMVTWTKVPGVKNYRVTYGIGSGARKTLNVGDVDNANITGLKHGQAYSIDVASVALDKKAVSPPSPRINPSTSALLPPTQLKVTGVTATTVTLTWTKAANADSYRLYYGIGSGVRTRIVLGDVSTATVTGLTKGKKYAFDIASVEPDGVGRSSYTTRVSATTK